MIDFKISEVSKFRIKIIILTLKISFSNLVFILFLKFFYLTKYIYLRNHTVEKLIDND